MTVKSDVGNFGMVPEWLFGSGVSYGAIALFALLATYADRKTSKCWPSRSTLADRMGASKDSIDRWNRELVAVGALEITSRSSKNGGISSNSYFLKYAGASRTGAAGGSRMGAATQPHQRGRNNNHVPTRDRTRANQNKNQKTP